MNWAAWVQKSGGRWGRRADTPRRSWSRMISSMVSLIACFSLPEHTPSSSGRAQKEGDYPRQTSLQDGVVGVPLVGNEHVARGVGNHQRWPGVQGHRLGRYPAGPEHRLLTRTYLHRVAEVGPVDITDTNDCRVPNVHRRTVSGREPGSDLHRSHNLLVSDGAHAHHHGAGKDSGRGGLNAGNVHGYVAAHFLVPQWYPGVGHGRLEREAAPQ